MAMDCQQGDCSNGGGSGLRVRRRKQPTEHFAVVDMMIMMMMILSSSSVHAWVLPTQQQTFQKHRGMIILPFLQRNHGYSLASSSSTQVFQSSSENSSVDLSAPTAASINTLPHNYRQVGEDLIYQAAAQCCGMTTEDFKKKVVQEDEESHQEEDENDAPTSQDQLITIDWSSPGKIVVTVNNDHASMDSSAASLEGGEFVLDEDELLQMTMDEPDNIWEQDESDVDMMEEEEDYYEDGEDYLEEVTEMFGDGGLEFLATPTTIDVVQLAKAINAALEPPLEDSNNDSSDNSKRMKEIGWLIAQTHEIEVTTPNRQDEEPELTGIMWTAYQGFDVKCEYVEPSKQKKNKDETDTTMVVVKTIEGRLRDRDDEYTTINIKGRMKRIPNENVNWVRLPKAKQEKNSSSGGGNKKNKKKKAGGSKKKRR